MTDPKLHRCKLCGASDIALTDCGYTRFNVGFARCIECHQEVRVSPYSDNPDELIAAWNRAQGPTNLEGANARCVALADQVAELRRALEFYANRNHWMNPFSEDGDCSNLIAHGTHFDGTSNGWVEAEAALHAANGTSGDSQNRENQQ